MKQILGLTLLIALLLSACSTQSSTASTQPTESTTLTTAAVSDMFTDIPVQQGEETLIRLNGATASCDARGVAVKQGVVSITAEGCYRLQGSFDGSIVVDTTSKAEVQLILDGVSITSASSAALYIKQAGHTHVLLTGENSLSNGGSFVAIDDSKIDGTLFSKDSLSFGGEGSLSVSAPAGHGIVCKDALSVLSGSFDITAEEHGMQVEDSIRIAGGSLALTAGKDAMHAEHDEDASLGFIYVADGVISANAQGDGISAGAYLQIDGGSYNITTGGGCTNGATHAEQFGGRGPAQTSTTDNGSQKGLKSAGDMQIYAGSFVLDSADDALHSGASILLAGGDYDIRSGDDAIHADALLKIEDGTLRVSQSYEGLEAQCVELCGGEISLVSSDDGINAAGGNDESGFGGNDMFANDTSAYVKITGGLLRLNASGDGIDSNGSIYVSGGETYVSGPTNNGNGSLDYGGEATVTGGIFVAAGSSGMATGFGRSSTQGAIFVSYNTQKAGSAVVLTDASGEEIFSWQTEKDSSSIVLSCPGIVQGETYHLTVGNIEGDITMTELIYGYSQGPGGGGPPNGGGRPPRG